MRDPGLTFIRPSHSAVEDSADRVDPAAGVTHAGAWPKVSDMIAMLMLILRLCPKGLSGGNLVGTERAIYPR